MVFCVAAFLDPALIFQINCKNNFHRESAIHQTLLLDQSLLRCDFLHHGPQLWYTNSIWSKEDLIPTIQVRHLVPKFIEGQWGIGGLFQHVFQLLCWLPLSLFYHNVHLQILWNHFFLQGLSFDEIESKNRDSCAIVIPEEGFTENHLKRSVHEFNICISYGIVIEHKLLTCLPCCFWVEETSASFKLTCSSTVDICGQANEDNIPEWAVLLRSFMFLRAVLFKESSYLLVPHFVC